MSEEVKEESVEDEEVEVSYAELELEGAVYYIEKDKDGNVISKSPLPPDAVLNAVISVLEAGLDGLEDEFDEDDSIVIE